MSVIPIDACGHLYIAKVMDGDRIDILARLLNHRDNEQGVHIA